MISIILPIRNEENTIARCLDAILSQDYDLDDIEILIADGMSTDKTREIILQYQRNNPQIFLIDNPEMIVPTGLNAAIKKSTGEIIIRIDGHTIIAPDYIRHCIETLHRTNADNVGGCMSAGGATLFGKVVAIATSVPFGIGNSKFHYSNHEQKVDSVYMGAWPRKVFHKIGLFDEELIRDQDDEFNYRLTKFHGKIILNPKIRSEYTVRSTPRALFKQYFQYGFWKIRVLQKHPKQMSLRQFIPAAFVSSLLITAILTTIFTWGKWLFILGAGLYLIANLISAIASSTSKERNMLVLLPLVFLIIHLSYGLGFLIGLGKFWNRWNDKTGIVPELQTN